MNYADVCIIIIIRDDVITIINIINISISSSSNSGNTFLYHYAIDI